MFKIVAVKIRVTVAAGMRVDIVNLVGHLVMALELNHTTI